ncbi:hypothetical protein BU25DRAFT_363565, partial [Macroventuria anomochaeta]
MSASNLEQGTTAAHYAILIGINRYPKDSLKGCVRDVHELKKRLESSSKAVDIRVFTASEGETSSVLPVRAPNLLPTYGNITTSFEQITSSAKSGDFVYIHYSGHGTTISQINNLPNDSPHDLALVLIELNPTFQPRYFHGLDLASRIKRMVEKGVTVTLVLDCCFSGNAVRTDARARYLDYDPAVDAAYPWSPVTRPNAENDPSASTYRAGSMRPNWLVNPNRYTILTACGPTEIAKEITLGKDGLSHGALSYFLLRTFHKLGGVGGRQEHIYHHLRARFKGFEKSRMNIQNPVFYGNKNLCFFGSVDLENRPAPVPIIRRANGTLELEAGEAHGISKGDGFILCPLDHATHDSVPDTDAIPATIKTVGALVSQLETDMADAQCLHIETGWIATQVTSLALRKFPVRLQSDLAYPAERGSALQDLNSLNLQSFDAELAQSPSFTIKSESDGTCSIYDEDSHDITQLHFKNSDLQGAKMHILAVLEHMARFKLVRSLANKTLLDPGHPFTTAFDVCLTNQAGISRRPGCLQEGWLHHGDWIEFAATNTAKGYDNLYLHIYNTDSCWAVENLLKANHVVLPSYRG